MNAGLETAAAKATAPSAQPRGEALHVILKGTMTALAPLATSPPGGDKKGPQRLPRERLPVDGQWIEQAHFPGRGIRGKLRRCTLAAVNAALIRAAGAPVLTVEDWFYNSVGGVKGTGDEDKADLLAVRARRMANPLISLFGSGQPWMNGRLAVGHAVPTVPLTPVVQAGIRSDDFMRDAAGLELLAPGEAERWLSMAVASSARSKAKAVGKSAERDLRRARRGSDEGLVQEAEGRLARSQATAAEADGKALSSVSILMPLEGYEVIPRGTELAHDIRLANATAIEFGLFLAGMREFSLDPRLGAHLAEGCGTIEGRWTVHVREETSWSFALAGEIGLSPLDGLTISADVASRALAAWDEARETIAERFDFRAPQK